MASSPTPVSPAGPDGEASRDDVARHLRNVLGALGLAVTDLLAEDAQERGFSAGEYAAIILIAAVAGLSQEDLQRRLGLSQPGTTRLVDRLVSRGLVIRDAGPDRRTNALRLTQAGRTEARHGLASRHRLLSRITAGFSGPEQRAAAALVDHMLRTLVQAGQSPWRICRQCDQQGCVAGHAACPVDEARLELESGG